MSKQLLLRGILFSFKYPLFMLLGGGRKDVFRKLQRDASRYLRVEPSSLSSFDVFSYLITNRNLASIYLARIRNYTFSWLLARVFFSYNRNVEIIVPINNIGPGLVILHNIGAVVRAKSLGEDVTISQGVTLGAGGDWNDTRKDNIPTIGDRVLIATNALVIGEITIGSDAVIGAGAVITKDIQKGDVVVGNPQRVIKNIFN